MPVVSATVVFNHHEHDKHYLMGEVIDRLVQAQKVHFIDDFLGRAIDGDIEQVLQVSRIYVEVQEIHKAPHRLYV